nr:hypothetical protein [Tanacetum cinerariifolium]
DDVTSNDDVPIEESKVCSNPLFDDDEINFDELESHVESDSVESLSNHDVLIDSSQRIDHLEEISEPLMPIHIAEEQRIRREHAEDISRVENDDDSEREVDVVEELHVDNSISNSANELSDNVASDFDNPSVPRPPPEPPDAEIDFEPDAGEEISVVMNDKDELECLDPRNEFDDGDYFPFMFVIRIFLPYLIFSKMFLSFLSAENEDTIFHPDISIQNQCLGHFVEIPSGEIK